MTAPTPEADEDWCTKPCDPDLNRPCCTEYWARMEHEGFWDRRAHRWTERGWREITK
ncbi:MAG: hypothetical protein HW395_57 [candidate division NC10 bacterium]|nr:hypothetical protein [candidate division NC10 bacterium]